MAAPVPVNDWPDDCCSTSTFSRGRLRQAEVEDLDRLLVPLAVQNQVVRLEVAVDKSFLMGVLKPERRLVDEEAGMGHRHRPLGLDQLGQVATLHVFHRKQETLAELGGVVGGDDVRVAEPGDGLDLTFEAFERSGYAVMCGPMTLSTSSRPIILLCARYTTPMPPRPSSCLISYSGWAASSGGSESPKHAVNVSATMSLWGPPALAAGRPVPFPGASEPGGPFRENCPPAPPKPVSGNHAFNQVLVDRFGRAIVELPEAIRCQGLVARVEGRIGVHQRSPGRGGRCPPYDRKGRFRVGPVAKIVELFQEVARLLP